MATVSAEAAAIVRVRIPTPLRSYTGGAAEVDVAVPVLAPELPPTLSAVLAEVERRHRGLRFRIVDEQGRVRRHIKVFIGRDVAQRGLASLVPAGHDVMIVAALSGG